MYYEEESQQLLQLSREEFISDGVKYLYNERTNNFVVEDEEEEVDDQEFWNDDDQEF